MNLKKALGMILLLLIILIGIVLVKTFTYPFSKTETVTAVSSPTIEVSEEALQRFAGGIRIPTISSVVYEETNFEPFDRFKAYLPEVYPEIYNTMETFTINEYGLVFHWKGKNSNLKPILFLSHYDVVPVTGYIESDSPVEIVYQPDDTHNAINAHQTDWDYPPFSGAVANGKIYGRGTLDMKNMLFSIMESADALIKQGFQPERDIWIAFGQDEEVGGHQGAIRISKYFEENGIEFDAVYDEGGIIAAPESALESIKRPVALIGMGEKGFLTVQIKVRGIGGHASMPPKDGSLTQAAEIMQKLNEEQMPTRIIPPIAAFLDNIGGEMSFVSRMAIANQWLLKPVLIGSLTKSPASNALVRTTTAVTMAKGSDAPNVLSAVSEITVNFRLLPGDTIEDVLKHVQQVCSGYDVEITPVSTREASAVSPEDTRGFEIIKENLTQLYPDAIISPYITIGGTDAYKYQPVSNHIYRFMPIELNTFEQRTIHNENEHISIENYGRMIWYFKTIMESY